MEKTRPKQKTTRVKRTRKRARKRTAKIRVGVIGVGRGGSFARGATKAVGMELVGIITIPALVEAAEDLMAALMEASEHLRT